ncbi:hypothetical protein LEN26_005748 [Aphanomyces euteiches]|nr:hypothetical protein AeMF1_000412 [Aphanomyces euteiches]KAH9137422.1 hypothetical protein LEN26_005748 [Aphanomyces euteiches]KAH9189418.1 hypothetical protein AeNC1_008609 [Aphanomyces euteiches]
MMQWSGSRLLLLLVLALTASTVIEALHDDQIGLFDWHRQGLGEVVHSVFPSKNSKNVKVTKAMYVASRANVLAKLDTKTSAIEWRHVLPEVSIESLLFCDSHASLVTVSNNVLPSGNSTIVRQWDAIHGSLLWQANLPVSTKVSTLQSFTQVHEVRGENEADETRVVVVRNQGVSILGLKGGDVLHSVAFKSGLSSLVSSKVSVDVTKLYILGVDSSSGSPVVLQVVLKTGAVSTVDVSNPSSLVTLYRDDDEDRVVAVGIATDGTSLSLQALYDLKKTATIKSAEFGAESAVAKVDTSLSHALVLSLTNGKRVLLRVSAALSVKIVSTLPVDGTLVDSIQSPGVVLHVASKASQISVTSHSTHSTEQTQFEVSVDLTAYGQAIIRGFAGVAFKKNGAALSVVRVALVLADASFMLLSNEKPTDGGVVPTNPIWIREEALAYVQQLYWVTPADSNDGLEKLSVIPSYVEELAIEAKKLTKFFSTISEAWQSSDARKHATTFGFAKLIVLYTSTGKLYALDSQTGDVVWSRFLGLNHQLLVTRDHPALGGGAELLIVTPSKQLLWLDAGDGTIVDQQTAPGNGKKWVVLLPKLKHAELDETIPRRVVAVFDQDTSAVDLFPAGEKVDDHVNHFYVRRYNVEQHAFQGYVLASPSSLQLVWSLVVPSNERIVAQSSQPDHLAIDSAVTILGDDSLLLKYLNPHLFGVATLDEQNVLYVSLVDGVSGRIVHRVKHRDAAEPVQMVQSENWLVYSFWSTKSKRTELVSLTLVEGGVPANGLNPWKQPYWANAKTSFDPKLPIVLQKSFIYPATITSLGVTVTSQGITPQFILVAQANGQIFKLARNFIDPRVPEGTPTPEQLSEGLIQYMPYVPVLANALSMVTYNQTVLSIRRIVCAPALLESTSLTFGYGLDLFYVRLAPANAFDVLPSDFNFELLILLCIGFVVAAYVTRVLAERKELHDAWK